jgi:hypothetical protein
MIRAYLDDSGTHRGSQCVVVAGWMGTAKTWRSFSREWNNYLKQSGISVFRASNFSCRQLKAPLADAICKRDLWGVAWKVNPLDYKKSAKSIYE